MGEMAEWFKEQMEQAKMIQQAMIAAEKHREKFQKYRENVYNSLLDLVLLICKIGKDELKHGVSVGDVTVVALYVVEDIAQMITHKATVGQLVYDACKKLGILKD